jgi:hypothetical protein
MAFALRALSVRSHWRLKNQATAATQLTSWFITSSAFVIGMPTTRRTNITESSPTSDALLDQHRPSRMAFNFYNSIQSPEKYFMTTITTTKFDSMSGARALQQVRKLCVQHLEARIGQLDTWSEAYGEKMWALEQQIAMIAAIPFDDIEHILDGARTGVGPLFDMDSREYRNLYSLMAVSQIATLSARHGLANAYDSPEAAAQGFGNPFREALPAD